jgi:parallel beta-helix repeat protein
MRRLALAVGVLFLLLPSGALAATNDFAYGAGVSAAGTSFAFSARSAPDGSNPAGRAILGGIFGNSEGAVTCLRVQGSIAAVGYRVERSSVASQLGKSYVAYLQDNGAFTNSDPVDKLDVAFATATPSICPGLGGSRPYAGFYGEAVVKDDTTLPPPAANPTWSLNNGKVQDGSFPSFRIAAMRAPDGSSIGYADLSGGEDGRLLVGKVVCLDVDGRNARIGIEPDTNRSRVVGQAAEVLAVDESDALGVTFFEDAENSGAADCRPPDPYPSPLTSGAVSNRTGDPLPPPPVRCGQTLRANATLTSDLRCQGTALTIGAPGITVDLAGHSVSGGQTSIKNTGYDNVTIKNGTLDVNTSGIALNGVTGNVLQNLDVLGLLFGIGLSGSDRNWIVGNRLSSVGMSLSSGSDGNVVRGNTFLGYESSLDIRDSTRNSVTRNIVHNYWETGMSLIQADHNVLADNDISAESGRGVGLWSSDDNEVSDNTIQGRPVGSHPVEVSGITIADSHRNLVARNAIQDTTTAIEVLSGWANVLQSNQGLLGVADGFVIEAGAVGTRLAGNWADGFEGDGFDVAAGSTRIGSNLATYNDELGIRAVKGVTDVGGNRAYGNRNAFQCLNVVCSG